MESMHPIAADSLLLPATKTRSTVHMRKWIFFGQLARATSRSCAWRGVLSGFWGIYPCLPTSMIWHASLAPHGQGLSKPTAITWQMLRCPATIQIVGILCRRARRSTASRVNGVTPPTHTTSLPTWQAAGPPICNESKSHKPICRCSFAKALARIRGRSPGP